MSRIFLSHSSHDDFAAVALRDWLASEGWDDVFLDLDPERGIAGGERWERALHAAAARCEAVVFLITGAWLASDWCRKEFELARGLNKQLFAVLVDPAKTLDDLPAALTRDWQVVNLVGGQDLTLLAARRPGSHEEKHIGFSLSGLVRLKRGLEKAGLEPKYFAWPPTGEPERAPYRGLKPLEKEDAGIYFGRAAPIVEATDWLRGLAAGGPPRLFVLLGASGAGKSSFLRAGLLPRLERDDAHFVTLAPIRPERAALTGEAGLVAALAAAFPERGRAELRAAVQGGAATLKPLLASLVAAARARRLDDTPTARPPAVLVTVDQAEELFRSHGREESEALLALLADLAAQDDPAVIVAFAIRSDSYDALERAKALEGLRQFAWPLLPMPRGAYADVIEGPARRFRQGGGKLAIEPRLAERLLADIEAGGGADALPLLAFTLEQLYLDYGRAGALRLADYEAFGGLQGAIDAAIERVFRRADDDARIPRDRDARLKLLRRGLIPWLAGIDPETKSPRRSIARRSDIPAEAAPLIDLMVEERLLTLSARGESDAAGVETRVATLEPTHEALLRQWGLLDGWLKADFGLLATLEAVQRSARDWDARAKDPAWLAHRGQRLAEANALDARPDIAGKFDATDRAYLAGCRERDAAEAEENEARRREREAAQARTLADAQKIAAVSQLAARRTRLGLAVALLLAAVAIVGGLLAWRERDSARQNAEQAQLAAAEAKRQETAAKNSAAEAKRQEAAAKNSAAEAKRQEAAAKTAATEAENQRAAAEKAHKAALVLQADRAAALSEQFDAENRPDLAAAVALNATPRDGADDRLLTTPLEAALRRSLDHVQLPVERFIGENVMSLALSSDGKTLAAGTVNGPNGSWVFVLDAASLKEEFRFKVGDDAVTGLDFSPDGSRLVATGDKIPVIFSLADRRKLFDLKRPNVKSFAKSARFTPDGQLVLIGTGENRALVYDAKTGALKFELPGSAFDESFERAKAETMDSAFGVADPIMYAVAKATFQIWGAATEVAVSGDGKLAAVTGPANPDNSVRLYNLATGKLARILTGGVASALGGVMGYGNTLEFTRDGLFVVAILRQESAKVWRIADGKLMTELDLRGVGRGQNAETFALTEDGRAMVSGQSNGTLLLRCLGGRFNTASFKAHDGNIGSMSVDESGKLLITGSDDRTVRVWRMPTGDDLCPKDLPGDRTLTDLSRPLATFVGHGAFVRRAIAAKDGRAVFTASGEGYVRRFTLDPASELSQPYPVVEEHLQSLETDPFGAGSLKVRALISGDGKDAWFDFEDTGWRRYSFAQKSWSAADRSPTAVVPGAPGRPAVALRDEFAALDDPAPDKPKDAAADLLADLDAIRAEAASPDGSRVIAVVKDDAQKADQERYGLYDRAARRLIKIIDLDGKTPSGFRFSADGARFIAQLQYTADFSKPSTKVGVWNAQDGAQLSSFELKSLAQPNEFELSADGDFISLLTQQTRMLRRISTGEDLTGATEGVVAGELLAPTASALTVKNEIVYGFADGALRADPMAAGGQPEDYETGGAAIATIVVSPDARYVVARDTANQIWIVDRASRTTRRSAAFVEPIEALAFMPDSQSILVAQKNAFSLMAVVPRVRGLNSALDMADWARAVRLAGVDAAAARHYDLSDDKKRTIAALAALKPFPTPSRRPYAKPAAAVAACDAVAGEPFDRERAGEWTVTTADQSKAARAACETARQADPGDLPTAFHLAELDEHDGKTADAAAAYEKLAGDGYAFAMVGLGRLVGRDRSGELAKRYGAADDWRRKALAAGDLQTLFEEASRVAQGDRRPATLLSAFAMLAAAGVDNRASAARVIFRRAAGVAQTDAAKAQALFFAFLADALERGYDDPAPAVYGDDRTYERNLAREWAQSLPAQDIVAPYRAARDWLRALP